MTARAVKVGFVAALLVGAMPWPIVGAPPQLTGKVAKPEKVLLVKVANHAGEVEYEEMSAAEFDTLRKKLQAESRVFARAMTLARQEWKTSPETMKLAFPDSAIRERKAQKLSIYNSHEEAFDAKLKLQMKQSAAAGRRPPSAETASTDAQAGAHFERILAKLMSEVAPSAMANPSATDIPQPVNAAPPVAVTPDARNSPVTTEPAEEFGQTPPEFPGRTTIALEAPTATLMDGGPTAQSILSWGDGVMFNEGSNADTRGDALVWRGVKMRVSGTYDVWVCYGVGNELRSGNNGLFYFGEHTDPVQLAMDSATTTNLPPERLFAARGCGGVSRNWFRLEPLTLKPGTTDFILACVENGLAQKAFWELRLIRRP